MRLPSAMRETMVSIVCLKQVVDLQQIRIKRETREPVTEGAPFIFGQFEKYALEAAVKLKEQHGGKVTALAGEGQVEGFDYRGAGDGGR